MRTDDRDRCQNLEHTRAGAPQSDSELLITVHCALGWLLPLAAALTCDDGHSPVESHLWSAHCCSAAEEEEVSRRRSSAERQAESSAVSATLSAAAAKEQARRATTTRELLTARLTTLTCINHSLTPHTRTRHGISESAGGELRRHSAAEATQRYERQQAWRACSVMEEGGGGRCSAAQADGRPHPLVQVDVRVLFFRSLDGSCSHGCCLSPASLLCRAHKEPCRWIQRRIER